jgi:hypothetical protein
LLLYMHLVIAEHVLKRWGKKEEKVNLKEEINIPKVHKDVDLVCSKPSYKDFIEKASKGMNGLTFL